MENSNICNFFYISWIIYKSMERGPTITKRFSTNILYVILSWKKNWYSVEKFALFLDQISPWPRTPFPQIHHPLHLDRMLASVAIAHVLVLSANYLQFPTMVLQTASAKTFNIIQKYSHLNGEISHLRFWANAFREEMLQHIICEGVVGCL